MTVLELRIPPLLLVVVAAIAMWLAARLAPSLTIAFPAPRVLAVVLSLAGVFISVAGVMAFRKAHTTVDPTRPEKSTSLVASGIYRHTRNPMYVGFLMVLAAWSVYLSNLMALAALPAFVVYMNRFQIQPEERALQARFGTAFTGYKQAVRRWV